MMNIYVPPVYGNLNFTIAGSADVTKTRIRADALGWLYLSVPTGKYIKGQVGTGQPLVLGYGLGITGDNNWGIGLFGADGATPTSPGIGTGGGDIYHNVPTGSTHRLIFGGVTGYRFASALCEFDRLSLGGTIGSSIDPGAGGLSLTNRILFSGAGTVDSAKTMIYANASAGSLCLQTPSAKSIYALIAGSATATFSAAALQLSSVGSAADYGLSLNSTNYYNFVRFYTNGALGGLFQTVSSSMYYNFDLHCWRSTAGVIRAQVDANGFNLAASGAALATNATQGHPRMPSCAGAPTGVPASIMTGTVPWVYDSVNNKIYCYNGAWKSVTLA